MASEYIARHAQLDAIAQRKVEECVTAVVDHIRSTQTDLETVRLAVDGDDPVGVKVELRFEGVRAELALAPEVVDVVEDRSLGWAIQHENPPGVTFLARRPGAINVDDQSSDRDLMESLEVESDLARDVLVRRHSGLAEKIAKRYRGKGVPDADLEQVAMLALVKAIQGYDVDYGDLRPYAAVTISGELKRLLRDQAWDLNVPRSTQENSMVVRQEKERLAQELGREPTSDEIADKLEIEETEVVSAMKASQAFAAASLDTPNEPDSRPIKATLAEPDANASSADRMVLEEAIAQLPSRLRWIVDLRFNQDMTQTEIAEIVGMSQMHVSRLLREAKDTLGDSLNADQFERG